MPCLSSTFCAYQNVLFHQVYVVALLSLGRGGRNDEDQTDDLSLVCGVVKYDGGTLIEITSLSRDTPLNTRTHLFPLSCQILSTSFSVFYQCVCVLFVTKKEKATTPRSLTTKCGKRPCTSFIPFLAHLGRGSQCNSVMMSLIVRGPVEQRSCPPLEVRDFVFRLV